MRRSHPAFRLVLALATLAAFLSACTRQEVRGPVEVRHYNVDWERSGAPTFEAQGLRVRGIVLTPTQWPLEGSLKRLFKGDFLGIIDAFDLRFHFSKIPSGVLEDLYGRGLVPAYLRVENAGAEARLFSPQDLLAVRDSAGSELAAADPGDLPRSFTRVDMERTLLAVAAVVLTVVVLIAGREGRIDLNTADVALRVPGRIAVDVSVQAQLESDSTAAGPDSAAGFGPGTGSDRSLLRAGALAPGEAREGIVLFRHRNLVVDWASARLVAH